MDKDELERIQVYASDIAQAAASHDLVEGMSEDPAVVTASTAAIRSLLALKAYDIIQKGPKPLTVSKAEFEELVR